MYVYSFFSEPGRIQCETAKAAYTQALHKLVTESYLKPATVIAHQSPRDMLFKYEDEERKKLSGIPSTKEVREAHETAMARLKRETEDAERVGMVCAEDVPDVL